VMERDSRLVRGSRPFLFTNCRTGEGLDAVLECLLAVVRSQ
jgi:urease accessory protein